MLRLSSLEWNLILVDNFTGMELAHLMQVNKRIQSEIQKNPTLIMLWKSRQSIVKPKSISIGMNWKEGGEGRYDNLCQSFFKKPKTPDGFRVLRSRFHILVMCDGYKFEERFFNMGLYLEHKLGKQNCIVLHWHFKRLTFNCIVDGHIGEDCCRLELHRGHVILIRIRKTCTKKKFLQTLPTIENEFEDFIVNNYSKYEKDYKAKYQSIQNKVDVMIPKPLPTCDYDEYDEICNKRRKLCREFGNMQSPDERLTRTLQIMYKDFESINKK